MTGYGEAHHQSDDISVSLELRALNNRYLKVSVRAAEPYHLLQPRDAIGRELDAIRARAPGVVTAFRDRLLERVRGLLDELDVQVDRNDLIKEVSIFAERSDIAEEVVRLASHLDQFREIVAE